MNLLFGILLLLVSVAITLFICFGLLPRIFDYVKELRYLKMNSDSSNSMYVRNDMYYDAESGSIEADQIPLH